MASLASTHSTAAPVFSNCDNKILSHIPRCRQMTSGKIDSQLDIWCQENKNPRTSDTNVYNHKLTIMVQVNFYYRQRLKRQIKKYRLKYSLCFIGVSPNQKFLLPTNPHSWPPEREEFYHCQLFCYTFIPNKTWLCFSSWY